MITTYKHKRPTDINQRAKLIVDIAIGEVEDNVEDGKDPVAAELGRQGGLIGGKLRAEKLSPERRREIASNAAKKRWKKD